LAARAIVAASLFSRSGDPCSQKLVTRNAPYAPSKAFVTLASSLMSASTTSAPRAANSRALSEAGLRVSARTVNPPPPSARIALASPPPWAPVAPTTAITLCSAMVFSFFAGFVDVSRTLLGGT
jgi:hypothetical protein